MAVWVLELRIYLKIMRIFTKEVKFPQDFPTVPRGFKFPQIFIFGGNFPTVGNPECDPRYVQVICSLYR